MKTIAVASTNPVKINATLLAFQKMFPGEEFETKSASTPSGVADQPTTGAETFQGALNRAEGVAITFPEADFWVGIEGGIQERDSDVEAFAWVVVKAKDGTRGRGRTGSFFLPPPVADLIRQGMELGKADDIVFGKTDSKQDNGAVGLLTDNLIDRTMFYADATILALIPFKNEAWYFNKSG